jgi:hypothetical protein
MKVDEEGGAMTSMFGDFRVRVDPWDVDYGDQTPLVTSPDQSDEQVDLDVELAADHWAAVKPPEGAGPHLTAVFVDGIRRLELRVTVRQNDRLVHGAFGSFAVGAVVVGTHNASFGPVRIYRKVVLGSGQQLPTPVPVRPELVYVPESTDGEDVDAPLQGIQKWMRQAEARLASELSGDGVLTIVDGPLSFEPERQGTALGYIKRIHELYVPAKFISLLATLPAGTRTPMFCIRSKRSGFARYSWFQRLAEPNRGATELHGVVRLEVSSKVGVDVARALANAATNWLPQLAPKPGRDPRSPQNLLPIGALEQQLRKWLGDARLHRRWIETLVAKESLNG